MSSHAMSILRGRRTLSSHLAAMVFSVALLFLLTANPQIVHAAPAPPPPDAIGLTATTAEDTAVTIDTGIPYDIRYAVSIVTPGPIHGTAVGGVSAGKFAIVYTPSANETSSVSFLYQICTLITAECGQSALAIVTITPVNDGPQAGTDNVTTNQGQSILIDVLVNDNAGPNEPGDYVSLVSGGVSTPSQGVALIEGNQIRYAPPANFCSATPVTFTYLAQDSYGLQVAGTVNVTVRCPGTPLLRLGEPYNFVNHTFLIDVVLESPDVNVAALDFLLTYATCLTDPDPVSNFMVADDVTNMPGGPNFLSQVQDDTFANRRLHFITASTTNPASVLAGPSAAPTRTIATIQFKATASPACPNPVLFDLVTAGFTGTDGTAITGTIQDKNASLANANAMPTSLALSNNKVPENTPSYIPVLRVNFIGKFSTTDPDTGDTFTYSFVPPYGDSSGKFRLNPLFNDELIVGNFNGAPAGVYSITVQSRDNYGGIIIKTFPIELTNVNRAPDAVADGTPTPLPVNGRTVLSTLRANDTDPDDPGCTKCSIQAVTNGSQGTVTNQGLSVTYLPTNPAFTGTDIFTYTLTDNDPLGALTDKATVAVNVIRTHAFGDCNKGGTIEAGDLTATGLEIFDGDGSDWYNADLGTYAFSPYGCNSNIDPVIDAGDISCTAQKIFNNAFVCGIAMAAGRSNTANLAIETVSATPGTTVQVPVVLSTSGNAVAAAAFAIDFNGDELSFDATDADNNGVADAVSLNIPAGLLATASYNAAESRIEVVMTGLIPPFPLLADGAVATVSLTVKEGVTVSESTVTLANSSLGSDEGQSIPLEVSNGSIEIVSQPASRILLPLIRMQ